MSKKIKIICLVTFSLLIGIFSYKFCYFIAEKYFFDKFFYHKSVTFGYGLDIEPNSKLEDYKERAKDLIALENPDKTKSLQVNGSKKFRIVIIGDSYVWGQGIKFDKSVSKVLEKKLNKIKPTEIITLARPCNSILDYYAYYKKIEKITSLDLYVYLMVSNDLAFNQDGRLLGNDYEGIIENCQATNPNDKTVYWLDWRQIYAEHPGISQKEVESIYDLNVADSWSSSSNLCVLDTVAKKFSNNSIFLITDDYTDSPVRPFFNKYKTTLINNNLKVISSESQKNNSKYSTYWKDDPWSFFRVSQMEIHPSALANEMYADALFEEITTNPKWGFITSSLP